MNEQLQQYFASLHDYPFQFHLRGTAGSGKSTLLSAVADRVQTGETAFTHRGKLLFDQTGRIKCHEATAPTAAPKLADDAAVAVAPAPTAAPKPADDAAADSVAPASALPVAQWPGEYIDGETFVFPLAGQDILGVAFPNDPAGELDSRLLAHYYANNPHRVFVPVFHFMRINHEVARRAYPNLILDMHDSSADDADLRHTIKAAYGVAFQKSATAFLASGVDGLEELLADERMIGARFVARGGRGVPRYRIPELPENVSRRYLEILAAVADNVVDLERLAIQPYREMLHNLPEPFCMVTHRDLARALASVWSQPHLIEEVSKHLLGSDMRRHSGNCLFVSSLSTKIKRRASHAVKSPVHVLQAETDGAAELLVVLKDRLGKAPLRGKVNGDDKTAREELVRALNGKPRMKSSTLGNGHVTVKMNGTPAPASVKEEDEAHDVEVVRKADAHSMNGTPTPASVMEDDEARGIDVLREAGAHWLRWFPWLGAATLLLAGLFRLGAGTAWLTIGWGILILLGLTILRAKVRVSCLPGSWNVTDRVVQLRMLIFRTISAPIEKIELRASWLESLCGVARAYVGGNRLHGWSIYQTPRFLAAAGLSRANVRWAPIPDIAAALVTIALSVFALVTILA